MEPQILYIINTANSKDYLKRGISSALAQRKEFLLRLEMSEFAKACPSQIYSHLNRTPFYSPQKVQKWVSFWK